MFCHESAGDAQFRLLFPIQVSSALMSALLLSAKAIDEHASLHQS